MERSRQAAGPQGRVSVRLPQGAGWLGGYLIWGAGEFRVGGVGSMLESPWLGWQESLPKKRSAALWELGTPLHRGAAK